MLLGYILQNLLGFFFALSLFLLPRPSRSAGEEDQRTSTVERLGYVLVQGCSCFYDSAVFLSFSVQLASVIMLARLDYGVSARGMGDSTVKITWAVSLLTMLPLMYLAYLPQLLEGLGPEKSNAKRVSKQKLRFGLFSICWLLSLYPFYSRMVGYFGPSLIGNGEGQVISDEEWNTVLASCTRDIKHISNQELIAMQFFGVAGSLFLSLCTLLKVVWLGLQRQHEHSKLVQRIGRYQPLIEPKSIILFLVLLPVFAISQIWTILRLRYFQAGISKITGNEYFDYQWSFGQIAAVTVFVPVLVECCFRWKN